jgi:hypothetical protein
MVTPSRGEPLFVTLSAADEKKAITYAKNRWPNSRDWQVVNSQELKE